MDSVFTLAFLIYGIISLGSVFLLFSNIRKVRERRKVILWLSWFFSLPTISFILGTAIYIVFLTAVPFYKDGCNGGVVGSCFGAGILLFVVGVASVPSLLISLALYFLATETKEPEQKDALPNGGN